MFNYPDSVSRVVHSTRNKKHLVEIARGCCFFCGKTVSRNLKAEKFCVRLRSASLLPPPFASETEDGPRKKGTPKWCPYRRFRRTTGDNHEAPTLLHVLHSAAHIAGVQVSDSGSPSDYRHSYRQNSSCGVSAPSGLPMICQR